jgi:hypothetical protein
VQHSVITAIENWWKAWSMGDLATIEELTAEAFVCLSENGTLRLQGKEALMREVRKFTTCCPMRRWSVEDPSVEHVEGASICTYKLGFNTYLSGHAVVFEDTMTDVLIEKDQNWKIVAHHGNLNVPVFQLFGFHLEVDPPCNEKADRPRA